MRSMLICAATCVALLTASGCIPEKRVSWSPDGRWATVKGADGGLYTCDAGGKLSPRLVENVNSVAWLNDSRRLVLSRVEEVRSYDEMAALLPPDRRALLESRARALRGEIMAHEGSWDDFKPTSLEGLRSAEPAAVLAFLREQADAELRQKLGRKWIDLDAVRPVVNSLQLVSLKSDGTLELGPAIARSPYEYSDIRVSPTGNALAYRGAPTGDDQVKPLYVANLAANSEPTLVTGRAAMFPDWSPDGQWLAYATTDATLPPDSKDLRLGTIVRRKVADQRGILGDSMPQPEELAGVVFQPEMRIRWLRDGRILFATLSIDLPCTSGDMPRRASLYSVAPGQQPGVTLLTSREAEEQLPDALLLFEVSPDEKHVSVPGGDGRVAVLALADGDVWEVLSGKDVDRLRMEPSWRSANELCFAFVPGPQAAKKRAAVALAKLDWAQKSLSRQIISADWPEEVVTGFLVDPKEQQPESQPTSAP